MRDLKTIFWEQWDHLAEMGPLSSKNKNVKYLLRVTDVFTKYAWVKPLKDKKDKTVLNAFIVNQINYGLIKA